MTLTTLLVVYAFGTGALGALAEGPHLRWPLRVVVFAQFLAVLVFAVRADLAPTDGGVLLIAPALLIGHFLTGGLVWRSSPALEGRSYLSRSWRAWHDGPALRRRHRDLTRPTPTSV